MYLSAATMANILDSITHLPITIYLSNLLMLVYEGPLS